MCVYIYICQNLLILKMYRISELNGSPKSEFSSILNSKIKTDLKMTFPIGYYGLLCSIPEIITKKGLEVISAPIWNGMSSIDVILYNNNQKEVNIFPREMIAYLIIHKYYNGLYIFENKK